jgi:hypothetical protein
MALETMSVRLDPDEITRLEAVAAVLTERAAGATITRSNALRAVVQAGLDALEAKYGAGKTRKGGRR